MNTLIKIIIANTEKYPNNNKLLGLVDMTLKWFWISTKIIFYFILFPVVTRGKNLENSNISAYQVTCSANAGTSQAICPGDKVIIGGSPAASGGVEPYSYSWSPVNGLNNPNIANPEASPKTTTLYTLEVEDANNCVSVSTVEITIYEQPKANAGPDQNLCLGQTITIGGNPSVKKGTPPYTYQWFPFIAIDDPTSANPSATPNISTEYFLLVEDANGCQDVDRVLITVDEPSNVDAGQDQEICITDLFVTLEGLVFGGSTTTGEWTSSGTGIFNPDNQSLTTEYFFSAEDKMLATINFQLGSTNNGACNIATDEIIVTFLPETEVMVGNDTTVCLASPDLQLEGLISGTTGNGLWTSTGSGTFSPSPQDLNPFYIPTSQDLDDGVVTITLTSINSNTCYEDSDKMIIRYKPLTVNAGIDLTVCTNNSEVQLSGMLDGVTTSPEWQTDGTGQFQPSNLVTGPIYIPGNEDFINGQTVLTLINHGSCEQVEDDILITFIEPPEINIISDNAICSNDTLTIQGNINGSYNNLLWSSNGSGIFIPNNSEQTTFYIPSSDDATNGLITLTLTVQSADFCLPVETRLDVVINRQPEISAGADQSMCANQNSLALNATTTINNALMSWSSNGSGQFIPTDDILNPEYIFSNDDKLDGEVVLTFKVIPDPPCSEISDAININFLEDFQIDAGLDMEICTDETQVQLNAFVNDASVEIEWKSSGTGLFSPNAFVHDPIYELSPDDHDQNSLTIVIKTVDQNICGQKLDSIIVNITEPVVVDAGDDISVCKDEFIDLEGTIDGNVNTFWASSGTGQFIPDNSSLKVTYIPSTEDLNTIIQLSINADHLCGIVSDTIKLSFKPDPVISAGEDINVCTNMDSIPVLGSALNTQETEWITTGTGKFLYDITEQENIYMPSEIDIQNDELTLILETTRNSGCKDVMDSLKIEFKKAPEVNAGVDITSSTAIVQVVGTVTEGDVMWSSSGTGSFSPNPFSTVVTYEASDIDILTGSVSLTLTATLSNCAPVSDEMKIIFSEGLSIPNAFTPNGDGINDYFLDGIDKVILNRWGKKIFEGIQGWDGKHNGTFVKSGTYYFQLRKTTFGELINGTVTVIRNE